MPSIKPQKKISKTKTKKKPTFIKNLSKLLKVI